jgi:hypothetical protein
MNAGEMPEGMPASRRALIARLEGLGYDTEAGVAANWREAMDDAAMRVAIAMLDSVVVFVDDNGNFKAESEDGTITVIDPAADEAAADFPDIGELVAAIDEVVAARDAFLNGTTPATIIESALRQDRAIDRCRELQKQIAKAQEALHA